jgi:hypothetical protein
MGCSWKGGLKENLLKIDSGFGAKVLIHSRVEHSWVQLTDLECQSGRCGLQSHCDNFVGIVIIIAI